MTNRKMKDAGVEPLLGYLLGLVGFVLVSEYIFQKSEFAKYFVILASLSVLFRLTDKNRINFLRSTFGDKVKNRIRLFENAILCLPFIAVLLSHSFFTESAALFLASMVLALVSFESNASFTIPTPFSKRPFEFAVGFRKSLAIILMSYAIMPISIRVDNLNLGIFSMALITFVALNFYTKPEPKYYVWAHASSPRTFVINKVLVASAHLSILVAPVFITLLAFFPTQFDVILFYSGLSFLFLWTIILAKYSAFPREIGLSEGIIIAMSIYFSPLLVALIPYFYIKSINKLKPLLDDSSR